MADLPGVTGAFSAEVDIDGDCFAPQALADLKAAAEIKLTEGGKGLVGAVQVGGPAMLPSSFHLSPEMLDGKLVGVSIGVAPPHVNCLHSYEDFLNPTALPTERRLERPGKRSLEF